MKIIKDGSCTSPIGFQANAISCGLKRKNKEDLAIIFSGKKAIATGLFTTNQIVAAPVLLTKKI